MFSSVKLGKAIAALCLMLSTENHNSTLLALEAGVGASLTGHNFCSKFNRALRFCDCPTFIGAYNKKKWGNILYFAGVNFKTC